MPPWLSTVNSVHRKESIFDSSRFVQLATIGVDNTPRVRTVVFRGWSESYEMQIYTDNRSKKCHELALNNNVEICWFFSESKCQFRFRGTARMDLDNEKFRHWEQLSENSKSMWNWPFPGDNYIFEQNKNLSDKKEDEISINFAVLKIDISQVDQLLLAKPIHIRRRWILENKWMEERINP